jgi:type VI secretion system secreted protein VgrG
MEEGRRLIVADPPRFPSPGPRVLPFQLSIASFGAEQLTVVSFRGREDLSRAYRFDILGRATGVDVAEFEEAVLQQGACLLIHDAVLPRVVRGIVASVSLDRIDAHDRLTFRVRIVPRLWLLKHRKNSRVFQDKSVAQIVELILREQGVASQWQLRASCPLRKYCVQYQETDFDFVHRLLAEVGIFYYFKHDADGDIAGHETIVFSDSADLYPSIPVNPRLAFRGSEGGDAMKREEHHVQRFDAKKTVVPKATRHRDYDFRRPGLDLAAAANDGTMALDGSARPAIPFEVYDHPAEYDDPVIAPEAAARHLDQVRRRAAAGKGSSACARLLPGHRFELVDHDVTPLNAEYVTTRIEHVGRSAEVAAGEPLYTNRFSCAPASFPVRPPRPEPQVRQVVESARVVGPPNQDIHTDEHGRIKVQFHWDNDGKHNEHSSCWIRVVQPLSGSTWGFQFIPRVGMEVVVAFLGGDPDRPLVLGSVNNALTPVSQALPEQKTRSGIRTQSSPGGGGANELLFEDRAGAEQLILTAQRDLDETTRNDHTASVGNDQRLAVVRDQFANVGGNQFESVGGDRSQVVNGDHDEFVGGTSRERISGDRNALVDGMAYESASEAMRAVETNYNVHVGEAYRMFVGREPGEGRIEVQSTGDQVFGAGRIARIVAQEGIELICGESVIEMKPEGITIRSKKLEIATTKSAVYRAGGMSLGGVSVISGKVVKVFSSGASLVLDASAHLDGTLVKLNCGGGSGGVGGAGPSPEKKKQLALKLLDGHFVPYSLKNFRALVEGATYAGTTKEDGSIDVEIPEEAESCSVTVWTDEYPDGPTRSWVVQLGALEPASEVRGAQQRLRNLGYYGGAVSGELDGSTREALQKFQTDNRLKATGELDAPTVEALTTMHGY